MQDNLDETIRALFIATLCKYDKRADPKALEQETIEAIWERLKRAATRTPHTAADLVLMEMEAES